MRTGATIDADGVYRYRLWRIWDDAKVPMTFIMLNPSTADARVDDPTIRRCIGFARREGSGGVVVVNLFAFRATKPAALLAADDPVGPRNGAFLERAVRASGPVVAAWGAWWDSHQDRLRPNVELFAREAGRPLLCLGTTKTGAPRHPLYVRGDQPLEPFRAR